MSTLKGWVCDRCGSENRLEDTRCLACLHTPKRKAFEGTLEGAFEGIKRCLSRAAGVFCTGLTSSIAAKAACAIRYILAAAMVILTFEAADILISSGISAAQFWDRAAVAVWEIRCGVEMRLESPAMTLDFLETYIEKLKFYLARY